MELQWEMEKYWETGNFDSEELLEYGNDKVATNLLTQKNSLRI